MTSTDSRSRARKPKPEQAPPTMLDQTSADAATMPPPPPDTMTGGTLSTTTVDVSAPTPPQLDDQGVGAPAAGWVYGRAVTHLWSYDAATGVWVWVEGIGWKRMSPNSEHGHSHMALLATMATHANLTIDYHEDAAGRIDQVLA